MGDDHRSLAENPFAHALLGHWRFGQSKLDVKQSSLRRVRSSNIKCASCLATLVAFSFLQLKGGIEFSEGTTAKWTFDVGIKQFRAEIFLHVEKTKIMLDGHGKFLI